ncbi:MAG: proline--tRNA ligase, partial [Flavobacteriales bacterium]
TKEKEFISLNEGSQRVSSLLEEIQSNLLQRAREFQDKNTHIVDDYKEFKNILENKGGLIKAHWDGTEETEQKIKEETKATVRCIPYNEEEEDGKCIYSGKPSKKRVL